MTLRVRRSTLKRVGVKGCARYDLWGDDGRLCSFVVPVNATKDDILATAWDHALDPSKVTDIVYACAAG